MADGTTVEVTASNPKGARPKLYEALDNCINRSRFNGWWSLLLFLYTPAGLLLTVLRLCMSLQVILMLALMPDGQLKKLMLRISIGLLGVIVTTEGKNINPKVYVANRVSYIDNIVLHLSTNCQTVAVGGSPSYPLTTLLSHRSIKNTHDQSLSEELAAELRDCVDYTPLAAQPEASPTNSSAILTLRPWPFMIGCSIQPLAISAYRLWPVHITRIGSSGWWDLLWHLFVPFTYYHVRFLESCEIGENESAEEFAIRTGKYLAAALKVRALTARREDIEKWLKDPPRPVIAAAEQPPSVPKLPVIPISEFKQFNKLTATIPQASPEIEAMVQQVTAVMPQIPHTAIRQDLLSTKSVDKTITNILEGRVQYRPLPTLQEAAGGGPSGRGSPAAVGGGPSGRGSPAAVGSGPSGRGSPAASSLFGGSKARSSHLSLQRQLSLDDRKKLLLEQARKRYSEKHS